MNMFDDDRQSEPSSGASFRQFEKKLLDDILGGSYDNRIRPAGTSLNISGVESGTIYPHSLMTAEI